jgi:hypothetical protein
MIDDERRRGEDRRKSGRPLNRRQSVAAVVAACIVAAVAVIAISSASGPNPSFTFSSDEAGVTFKCSLDGATATTCTSPLNQTGLTPGAHTETIIGSFTVSTPPPPGSVLFGDQKIESYADNNAAGVAQAFSYAALVTGSTTDAQMYVNAGNTATTLLIGVYADAAGKPGALLASGSLSSPRSSAWNDVPLTATSIAAGAKYWVAVLGTGGTLTYRDVTSGTASYVNSTAGLTSLPQTYQPGNVWPASPASVYINGTPTTTTSTSTTSTTPTTSSTTSTTSTTPTTTTTTSSSTTTTTPPPPPTGLVGAGAEPPVTCTTSLNPGQNVSSAVTSAAPGSVVCLNPGSWGNISIASTMNPSTPVTLAAAPGQTVTIGTFSIDAIVENLTVEGFNATEFHVDDPSTGGITFQYNTVSHVPQGDAFVLYSNAHGGQPTAPISGVTVAYNQIDHVGECLGDVYNQDHTTFTHNVCGPGLGYGDTASTDPGHYIQTGGEDNMTVTHNAFLGPADPAAARSGLHLNVFHDWGSSTNLTFSGNLLWHDDAIGQAMLLQTGQFNNVQINNNLAVEVNDGQTAYALWVDGTHGLQFENNTTVDSYWGNLVTISQTSQDYPNSTGVTYTGNITVGTVNNSDGGYGNCSSSCVFSNDFTGDGSQGTKWTPNWQNTNWTPSSPYMPPPVGYYQPADITAGYQGTAGP